MSQDRVLVEAALTLYAIANLFFLLELGTNQKALARAGNIFGGFGILTHIASLIVAGILQGRCPILDAYHTLGLLAILTLTANFVIQATMRGLPGLGFFATSLSFLFTFLSLQAPQSAPSSMRLTGTLLEIHITATVLGVGMLALAFCVSIAYLLQDSLLHGKWCLRFSKRLPALETLDRVTNFLASLGFALLSVGILFGGIWAKQQWGQGWNWDPKVVLTLMTWLTYAVYIYARTLSGWKGRRAVFLLIVGFVLAAATFLGGNILPSHHKFSP